MDQLGMIIKTFIGNQRPTSKNKQYRRKWAVA